ncbi:uncharacterized protein [Arachis hypogaea]|uniref:Small ribosomal subunit protein bS18c n=1 Tax=Arachis hypogaea TaxID=3818 RepID=A0A445DKA4_ARAHY|nr:hypothetical protein Ahy_A04g021435 isoform B [Arachis hypogaea]
MFGTKMIICPYTTSLDVQFLSQIYLLIFVKPLPEVQADNGTVNQQTNKLETPEEFEGRIFGDNPGRSSSVDSFFEKVSRWGKAQDRSKGDNSWLDDLEESFDTLSDGMDGKLKNAARYFEYDSDEVEEEDYSFRYDATFWPYTTYELRDLDFTKPGVRKPKPRDEFQITTKEVLSQADFRNVSFLANFITEAGIIIKRSKTGISAKAQRKVAREIKTARAFGLMPFTTMGTKAFISGRTMENVDDDFAYETFGRKMHADPAMEDDYSRERR